MNSGESYRGAVLFNSILDRLHSIANTTVAAYCIIGPFGLLFDNFISLWIGCPLFKTRNVQMPDTPSFSSDKASRFFDIYLKYLINSSIPEKQQRWYVKRVEEFIKCQNGHKIKSLSSTDIENYFNMIGRQNRLKSWQFYQCVDAIRILYCQLLMTPVCQDVDWHKLRTPIKWHVDNCLSQNKPVLFRFNSQNKPTRTRISLFPISVH